VARIELASLAGGRLLVLANADTHAGVRLKFERELIAI
jgi:hypothetical protein